MWETFIRTPFCSKFQTEMNLILFPVIFIERSHGFGYLSNGEVNSQYNKCMMNGEFDQVCVYLCGQADDAEGKSSEEDFEYLEQQCDKCRGKNYGVEVKGVPH